MALRRSPLLLMLSSLLGPQARDYALPATFVVFVAAIVARCADRLRAADGDAAVSPHLAPIPLSVVPINMQGGISSFVMLSIPFFILAGYVMTEGGLSSG